MADGDSVAAVALRMAERLAVTGHANQERKVTEFLDLYAECYQAALGRRMVTKKATDQD